MILYDKDDVRGAFYAGVSTRMIGTRIALSFFHVTFAHSFYDWIDLWTYLREEIDG